MSFWRARTEGHLALGHKGKLLAIAIVHRKELITITRGLAHFLGHIGNFNGFHVNQAVAHV